ncbi:MAG: hypothetical protein B7Z34_04430 [Novosphingobium sp. 12-62-10]|nr:MAG: hypothetical protein B7Z34_04430 [Novosphingobium sp. 12-62-10]
MDIDVYQSTTNRDKFVSVPAGSDVTIMFPQDIDRDLITLRPYREGMTIEASDKRIAMDSADIIRQIEQQGYATHGVSVTVKVSSQATRL